MDPTAWNVPFPVVVGALFVIVMCRANGTYWLGRLGSAGARRTRLARLMDSPGYRSATARIDRYGAPVVAVSFLTIGFQTLANLAAGATGMKLRHYLPAVTIGSVAWALLYATLGTVGVDLFGDLWARSPALAIGLGVLVVGAIVGFVVLQHRRGARAAEPQPDDSIAA
ncbi:MAG: VTT domain-containing protein [Propionicimonas sp.]|uniref:DedA family protein n=1 Tax=Propionicimonas sp. TaxID=1955623 RepID=UPI003D0FF3AD